MNSKETQQMGQSTRSRQEFKERFNEEVQRQDNQQDYNNPVKCKGFQCPQAVGTVKRAFLNLIHRLGGDYLVKP